MALGKATGAFDKVLRPIMSNEGNHLADVILKGDFSRKTKTAEDIIRLVRAFATGLPLPQVQKLPIRNYHWDKNNLNILHLKKSIGENGCAVEIKFREVLSFSDNQIAALMDAISDQKTSPAPKPKGQTPS